ELLRALRSGGDLSGLPGLVRRAADGHGSTAAPISDTPLPPAAIVGPHYEGYFERLAESQAGSWVQPMLVVEGARGCWWGEKHHCTFCGLNGSTMQFRSKSPARFHDEIVDLVRRHQVLDMFVVDNILDMGYLTSLLPRLAEDGYDLRLQYEIKSNVRRDQLEILAGAGLVSIQPGIENLDSTVLRIMDKGVTGAQNVKMLRDSSSCHLSVLWNYLYGFPGETDAHYGVMVAQFPALHHLQPPGGATRIVIERFSPYFNDPALGFPGLRPGRQYGLIYDLPDEELYDMAYLFDSVPQGIGGQVEKDLNDAVTRWQEAHLTSTLTVCDLGDALVLANRREQFPWETLRLTDPLEVAAFRLLEHPRTVTGLTRALAETGLVASDEPGKPAEPNATTEAAEGHIAALIRRWTDLGLLFHDGVRIVHVAVDAANQDVYRLDERRLFGDRPVSELVGVDA
ncbi:MAG TPA: RiPP maturation radical SAM C-methyltransferase, partial [Actinocrinis sp.]|uniref:RiPP maturation radical SAM C-methyltransferase n=1 Tax=Actinocrinis sp. TaxID=1920516 RepID=UPI002DDD9386